MSFVDYSAECEFPIQNIPWGVYQHESGPHAASAIGDQLVDAHVLAEAGLFENDQVGAALQTGSLDAFMALDREAWRHARVTLQRLLSKDCEVLRDNQDLRARALRPLAQAQMLMPCRIGDYTDFYSSRQHATNVGKMFRPDSEPLLPNWRHLPVGYHGRASSVVMTGTPVRRPCGQLKADNVPPTFGACRLLDFELEMGFFVGGPANALGDRIPITQADQRIFGVTILNDWSARDIQKWEYVPLGPFGAKNFASTISPWIVTLDALAPFRIAGEVQDPPVLPYLQDPEPGAYNIDLQVLLAAPDAEPLTICRSNSKCLYWSMKQQLTHHSVTGCNMQPGDLCGSGTISGDTDESYGSMLEITWRGTKPLTLPNGQQRKFIQDGDTVIMRGYAQGEGFRVGFGDCVGTILPANLD